MSFLFAYSLWAREERSGEGVELWWHVLARGTFYASNYKSVN